MTAGAGRKIRVLHVVEAIDAGVKRHVVSVLGSLDRQRFAVDVAAPTSRPETSEGATFVSEIAELGARLHPIEMRRAVSPFYDARALWQLVALMRRERYDVVHGHSSKGGFLARLAGWSTGTPAVYTPHAMYFQRLPNGWRRQVYRLLERLAGRVTSRFVAVSESEREVAIGARLVPPERIIVIRNGVEPDAFDRPAGARATVRGELGIPLDAVVVGAATRFTAQKNPECLVLAMAELVARARRDVYLVWAGDGELVPAVRRLIGDRGLEERCRLLGTRRDMKAVMSAFDIVALTSRYEGLPYVLLEGMALGLPVVATDVVGNRDVVLDGVNGFLADVQSPSAVADALLRLVNDEELRARLGQNGRRMVAERFTLEAMIAGLEALYTELAEGRAGFAAEARWLQETAST